MCPVSPASTVLQAGDHGPVCIAGLHDLLHHDSHGLATLAEMGDPFTPLICVSHL